MKNKVHSGIKQQDSGTQKTAASDNPVTTYLLNVPTNYE